MSRAWHFFFFAPACVIESPATRFFSFSLHCFFKPANIFLHALQLSVSLCVSHFFLFALGRASDLERQRVEFFHVRVCKTVYLTAWVKWNESVCGETARKNVYIYAFCSRPLGSPPAVPDVKCVVERLQHGVQHDRYARAWLQEDQHLPDDALRGDTQTRLREGLRGSESYLVPVHTYAVRVRRLPALNVVLEHRVPRSNIFIRMPRASVSQIEDVRRVIHIYMRSECACIGCVVSGIRVHGPLDAFATRTSTTVCGAAGVHNLLDFFYVEFCIQDAYIPSVCTRDIFFCREPES